MDRLNISNVIIEVTRKCNMTCDHCLRGNVQNKNISDAVLDEFFSRVDLIDTLTISGGEPSLVPDRIQAVVNSAKKHGTEIGNFYLVTNAKHVTPEFLLAVMNLYCYCTDNELSALTYSDDVHHEQVDDNNIKMLNVFNFTQARGDSRAKYGEYEIREGRAKQNGLGTRTNANDMQYFDLESSIYDQTVSEIEVYLNAKGNIINGCNWSYKSQDSKKNIICAVKDMDIDAFYTYFEKFQEQAA